MSRFETVLCLTLVAATVTVLGFAIVRPPASRSEPEAAPSSASPVRPSSGGLLLAPTGTPDRQVNRPDVHSAMSGSAGDGAVASGVPPSQSPPAAEVRVTTASARRVSGLATWYCCTRGYSARAYAAAAGPALRLGHWRGRQVRVCRADRPSRCVLARLVDACACGRGRIIDLHPGPMRALAPLSVGVVRVRVTWS